MYSGEPPLDRAAAAGTRRSPTIIDVAAAAGVSTATVSRALNGGIVSQQARERVLRAVKRLGYRPNTLARGLVTGRTGVVGVLIPDVAGPLYATMARGIEDVLHPSGLTFMLMTGNRNEGDESAAIELMLERQVDAFILIGSGLQHEPLEDLLRGGPPVILMEREGAAENFTTIRLANAEGAHLATAHLIERGHRRIAHVAGIRRAGMRRLDGYHAALDSAGLEAGPVLQGDFTEESGVAAAEALLQGGGVSAVFCANDRMALGLYHGLRARRVRVPDDISVVGFDDLPWGAYLDPPLTTVRQSAREMGRLAARYALASLRGAHATAETVVPAELVVRASVRDLRRDERPKTVPDGR